jgi:GNAT superfamily N-acetyltransferase
VLRGLAERWGGLDTSLNADLEDVAVSYRDDVFLVAACEGSVIGAGAVLLAGPSRGKVVRMSVETACRRQGIGAQLLHRLVGRAAGAGVDRLVVATTATWTDARRFYERFGLRLARVEPSEFGDDPVYVLDLA